MDIKPKIRIAYFHILSNSNCTSHHLGLRCQGARAPLNPLLFTCTGSKACSRTQSGGSNLSPDTPSSLKVSGLEESREGIGEPEGLGLAPRALCPRCHKDSYPCPHPILNRYHCQALEGRRKGIVGLRTRCGLQTIPQDW